MPIELLDTLAQQQYREDLEKYRKKTDAMFDKQPGPPGWPVHPSPPKPLFSSKAEPPPDGFMDDSAHMRSRYGADPHFTTTEPELPPVDGTAHEEVKGHDSRWTSCEDAPAKPFTLKK
jgi:hypothetical protein